jgi:predicted metal-dependent hydrolase
MFRQLSFFQSLLWTPNETKPEKRKARARQAPPKAGGHRHPPETGDKRHPPETGDKRHPPETGDKRHPPETGDKRQPETLFLGERAVAVSRKAYRRSIGLTLQVNGEIRVSAPRTTAPARILAFLRANEAWIEAQLFRYDELRRAHPAKRFVDGERFPFLGESLILCREAAPVSRPRARRRGEALALEIPARRWAEFEREAPHPEAARAVAGFYESAGRELLAERLRLYSGRMGLEPSGVSFRSQKTRWGSCSSKGRLSLNWRLAFAPIAVIDYVIVHELAHLRHYNHSAAFWKLVESHAPSHLALRQWLRKNQYEADFLAKRSELHPAK